MLDEWLMGGVVAWRSCQRLGAPLFRIGILGMDILNRYARTAVMKKQAAAGLPEMHRCLEKYRWPRWE